MNHGQPEPQQEIVNLKDKAEQVMHDIQEHLRQNPQKSTGMMDAILGIIARQVSDADIEAASERVQSLRQAHPTATTDELVTQLIRDKCRQTGMVGAATSGAAMLPGLGTFFAMTVGVAADIGMTFKLQAELVLEIAEAHGCALSEEEKRRAILLVTGISAGSSMLLVRLGNRVSRHVGERVAARWVAHALPIIGVMASASTNVLSTYIIGQRANAYFGDNQRHMGSWWDNVRSITGVDERRIAQWLSDTKNYATTVAVQKSSMIVQKGKNVLQLLPWRSKSSPPTYQIEADAPPRQLETSDEPRES